MNGFRAWPLDENVSVRSTQSKRTKRKTKVCYNTTINVLKIIVIVVVIIIAMVVATLKRINKKKRREKKNQKLDPKICTIKKTVILYNYTNVFISKR